MPVWLRLAVAATIGYLAHGLAGESIPDKATLVTLAAAIVTFGLLEIVDRIAVRDD